MPSASTRSKTALAALPRCAERACPGHDRRPQGRARHLPLLGPYAVSKASLDKLVKIYAGEISKTRVRANLLDPGIVRTRLPARAFPGEDPSRLPPPESVADAFLALALPECSRNGELVMASAVSFATE